MADGHGEQDNLPVGWERIQPSSLDAKCPKHSAGSESSNLPTKDGSESLHQLQDGSSCYELGSHLEIGLDNIYVEQLFKIANCPVSAPKVEEVTINFNKKPPLDEPYPKSDQIYNSKILQRIPFEKLINCSRLKIIAAYEYSRDWTNLSLSRDGEPFDAVAALAAPIVLNLPQALKSVVITSTDSIQLIVELELRPAEQTEGGVPSRRRSIDNTADLSLDRLEIDSQFYSKFDYGWIEELLRRSPKLSCLHLSHLVSRERPDIFGSIAAAGWAPPLKDFRLVHASGSVDDILRPLRGSGASLRSLALSSVHLYASSDAADENNAPDGAWPNFVARLAREFTSLRDVSIGDMYNPRSKRRFRRERVLFVGIGGDTPVEGSSGGAGFEVFDRCGDKGWRGVRYLGPDVGKALKVLAASVKTVEV